MTTKSLHRIPSEAMLGGVSAGLADYFGIDKVFVRLFFALMLILPTSVPVVIVYIILWIVMPKGERYFEAHTGQQRH